MLSHSSGVVPNALLNRKAIGVLTPEWPLTSSDKALRVIPSASAASVTVKFKGFKYNSFKTSPGCAGLCIRILCSSSPFLKIFVNGFNIQKKVISDVVDNWISTLLCKLTNSNTPAIHHSFSLMSFSTNSSFPYV